MRWDFGMVRRGLVVFAVAAIVAGWTAYAAQQAAKDVGRTVSFGLGAGVR